MLTMCMRSIILSARARRWPARDTVSLPAAGDTFIGYFLAELMRTGEPARALKLGCQAAAIAVTRRGASDSIPWLNELRETA